MEGASGKANCEQQLPSMPIPRPSLGSAGQRLTELLGQAYEPALPSGKGQVHSRQLVCLPFLQLILGGPGQPLSSLLL